MRFASLPIVVTTILLSSLSAPAQAGVSGAIVCNKEGDFCWLKGLAISGSITAETLKKVNDMIVQLRSKTRELSGNSVALDSGGGSIHAAMEIGRLLRNNRMTAVIPTTSVCVSACVLIYAGAVQRLGHGNPSRLGIHQPYLDVKQETVDATGIKSVYAKVLSDIRGYFREMNVSEYLADEMLKTPPSKVRYLTQRQQEKFGLSFLDPVEREISTIEKARELGIDRTELNRRESLAHRLCPVTGFLPCYQATVKTGDAPAPDFSEFGTPVE